MPFSGPMIRRLLRREKSQTRRIAAVRTPGVVEQISESSWLFRPRDLTTDKSQLMQCPYGVSGNQLWVSEAWYADPLLDELAHIPVKPGLQYRPIHYAADQAKSPHYLGRYRSARTMPQWASRLMIRLEDVSLQRIQDITPSDCDAEGFNLSGENVNAQESPIVTVDRVAAFRKVWEGINGGGNWVSNPWVWKLQFSVHGDNASQSMPIGNE
jgi:hypothetical protein